MNVDVPVERKYINDLSVISYTSEYGCHDARESIKLTPFYGFPGRHTAVGKDEVTRSNKAVRSAAATAAAAFTITTEAYAVYDVAPITVFVILRSRIKAFQ